MIVVFIKGKMFQTENFSPFFAILRKQINKKLLVIYPSKKDYDYICQNKDVYKSLLQIAKIKYFYSTNDIYEKFKFANKNRFLIFFCGLLSVLHRNFVLLFFLYRSVFLFSTEKIPFINWLLNYNKLFLKGKFLSLLIYPDNFKAYKRYSDRQKFGKPNLIPFKKLLELDSDVLVSSFTSKDLQKISTSLVNKYNIFSIGYNLSSWPTWMSILEKNVDSELKTLKKGNYIFYPLSVLRRQSYTKKGIIDLDFTNILLFLLDQINNINKNILIVLRPHPTTDVNKLKELIKCSKHKNIKISNINSLFLIKHSKFMIHYGVSMLDSKANIFNKICLRFHDKSLIKAGPELVNSNDNSLPNTIDITNKTELKKILLKVFNHQITIKKNKIAIPDEIKLIDGFVNFIKNE